MATGAQAGHESPLVAADVSHLHLSGGMNVLQNSFA